MIKFLKSMAIPTAALVALPGIASASVGLAPDDFVGISFWVISMCMVAATAFFFLETNNVSGKWKTFTIFAQNKETFKKETQIK